jgi:hypothetical protein
MHFQSSKLHCRVRCRTRNPRHGKRAKNSRSSNKNPDFLYHLDGLLRTALACLCTAPTRHQYRPKKKQYQQQTSSMWPLLNTIPSPACMQSLLGIRLSHILTYRLLLFWFIPAFLYITSQRSMKWLVCLLTNKVVLNRDPASLRWLVYHGDFGLVGLTNIVNVLQKTTYTSCTAFRASHKMIACILSTAS